MSEIICEFLSMRESACVCVSQRVSEMHCECEHERQSVVFVCVIERVCEKERAQEIMRVREFVIVCVCEGVSE